MLNIVAESNKWKDTERKVAAQIYDSINYDLLIRSYDAGNYLIPLNDTSAETADAFFKQAGSSALSQVSMSSLEKAQVTKFVESVQSEVELIPDIVPFIANEIQIISKNGRTYLVFSTAYWNQGEGPLELIPGARDENYVGDVRTNIYQRIYRTDKTYRSRLAGTFLWHDIHDHYHFDDFMDYTLEAVDVRLGVQPVVKKTSFCVRDRDFIKKLENSPSGCKYIDCSTQIQGVSVGYGDTYRYHLADQEIDVTDFPKGTYRLTFDVNSGNYFDEIRTDNNSSNVEIYLDAANQKVTVKN